jgi:hypothetical protein
MWGAAKKHWAVSIVVLLVVIYWVAPLVLALGVGSATAISSNSN